MERYKIIVSGRVQGVGFRPTVYRYAVQENLAGFVINTSEGVIIEVEGNKLSIKIFLGKLKNTPPIQARITKITLKKIILQYDKKFVIKKSTVDNKALLNISPDIAICDDCLHELYDKNNHRYLYPFINCTNCGPRFSIIKDIPYDRKNTTMQSFNMCKVCGNDYENPSDRRFHAQPNACWDCGPNVELVRGPRSLPADGLVVGEVQGQGLKAIQKTIELLKKGKIVAIKGIGGFHIACDATNNDAVKKLRIRKSRPDKPFAVMMPDIKAVKKFCHVNKAEEKVLLSSERPIVLLKKRQGEVISDFVSPNNNSLGVMLPYAPLHYLLFNFQFPISNFSALVMTSGNKQDEPICKDNKEVLKELSGICDYFLLHNRDIFNRCDDSIVQIDCKGEQRIIRRSRGYVPNPIPLASPSFSGGLPDVLATGAELKNTFCLTRGSEAYISQYIGDLKDLKTYEFYKEAIENMKNLLKVNPKVIACDLHLDYLSTQYAKDLQTMNSRPRTPDLGPRTIFIQHHHAHIASVCAENNINEKIIGVAYDGTGYGTDNAIWGGEFLVVDGGTFERKYHLKYIKLPGGDAAANEIWRTGFSYLYSILGEKAVRFYKNKKITVIKNMIDKNINSPLTSSMGRLFDAVASIINLRQETTYEAQAAIELENLAVDGCKGPVKSYNYEIIGDEIDVKKMIIEIINDLKKKKSKGEISFKFHNTLAEIILDVCQKLRKETKINKVALSGGVFQNMTLLGKAIELLKNAGFSVFTNKEVPTNDGGISLGQVYVSKLACGGLHS
ncbi:MAG: carbamoyltransferase HypF [Elusimicrobia bacterium]|nr:carbamoyltransferase HypF [Elusimicrobiota bacterium]